MNRWFLDENDIDIYLKCTDDVRWHYNKKELVRILNDLEAKLAEKDKAIENWETMYKGVVQTCKNDKEEIKKLKKQNDDYADSLTKVLNENAELVFKLAEKEKDLIIKCRTIGVLVEKNEKNNQDKISFALEQLEKVKELLYAELRFDYSLYLRAMHEIDNQIKQLKEKNV